VFPDLTLGYLHQVFRCCERSPVIKEISLNAIYNNEGEADFTSQVRLTLIILGRALLVPFKTYLPIHLEFKHFGVLQNIQAK
jgi:hypothetical protein